MSSLLEQLQWRYATKKMDATRQVPSDKLERIIEAARMAPTSSGLQPFELLVISHPELRQRIRAAANDQSQITDGSHLLVFAAWDNYTPERINHMFDLNIALRGGTNEGWENYRRLLLKNYPPREAQVNFEHAARQAYIAMGFALIAAASEQVDSTPMEGFDPKAVDEILNLSAKGLRSVAIMPLGYRASGQDWLENLVKVRRPLAEFVTHIN